MSKRTRVTYIDPAVMFPPGTSLYDDGVYRRRNGLADKPALLTGDEIAALDPATLTQRETAGDRALFERLNPMRLP